MLHMRLYCFARCGHRRRVKVASLAVPRPRPTLRQTASPSKRRLPRPEYAGPAQPEPQQAPVRLSAPSVSPFAPPRSPPEGRRWPIASPVGPPARPLRTYLIFAENLDWWTSFCRSLPLPWRDVGPFFHGETILSRTAPVGGGPGVTIPAMPPLAATADTAQPESRPRGDAHQTRGREASNGQKRTCPALCSLIGCGSVGPGRVGDSSSGVPRRSDGRPGTATLP